eukprot:3300280-Amphidinium_carterae.1
MRFKVSSSMSCQLDSQQMYGNGSAGKGLVVQVGKTTCNMSGPTLSSVVADATSMPTGSSA